MRNKLIYCQICNKKFTTLCSLSRHLRKDHNINKKEYYDKYIKKDNEGKCKICGELTVFRGLHGYKLTCEKKTNPKCSILYAQQETINAMIKKYGVSNPYQIPKNKENCIKNLKKFYKDKNKVLIAKKKYKDTCLQKYGVENISQSEKSQNKNGFKYYNYKGIKCQGSYELDFIKNYYDKFTDIKRGPCIKYSFKRKEHIYHADYYIPSLNLIIEIKNKNLYNRDKNQIKAKKKATISNGFNYIMILEKNYKQFNKLYNN